MLSESGARPSSAAAAARPGRRPSATVLPPCVLPLLLPLLLATSRPASVDGFALKPHGGGLPGGNTRYGQCAAIGGADPTRPASCLFFMGGGGSRGGAKEDEDNGGEGGDHGKKALLLDSELHLASGYPFPHASRSNIRRRAMKFLRGGSGHGDFHEEASPPSLKSGGSEITSQTPDSVIGETLSVQGTVEFKELLRIDGHFEGEVVGDGSLIIGPTAEVISNLSGLNEVYVEGILIGDCSCNKMQIRGSGCVTGNLMTGSLGMDPSVVLKGSANVDKLRSRNSSTSSKASSKDDAKSDSKGSGDDSKGGGSSGSSGGSSSSSTSAAGGGWKPPSMSASTTGAATVSAPTVSAPAVSAPKSPSAVYSHSGGGRQETGASGRGAGWSPSVSSHSSSSSLMAPSRRLSGGGVRGGGTVGLLWPRGDDPASVMARKVLSLLDAGVYVLRRCLQQCAPFYSCFQRCPPAADYYFLQSPANRR